MAENEISTGRPTRVVIVGGGSAGWITAAYMDATLNRRGRRRVDISVIESERIGRIGVGESTIPTITRTLHAIDIPERDFMRATNATFKQAIKFVNWLAVGHEYLHPFTRLPAGKNEPKGYEWLCSDRSTPFASTVSLQAYTAEMALAPKLSNHPDYQGPLLYAYHLDALRFADLLRDVAVSRGVTHIVDDVVAVDVDASDHIRAVSTASGAEVGADIFIDCTGFARLLIGKALGAAFESFADFLICDRAIAMPVPYDLVHPKRLETTTASVAMSAGWIWDVPLQDRRGTGYVYSSRFISDDDAEAELIRYVGEIAKDQPKNRIKFETGRLKTPWKGNCIAIGLSAGFIEPLESTGIWSIEDGVDLLCELLPQFGDMGRCRDLYNEICGRRFDENADFINMHYCLARRADTPFWREVVKDERISPTLAKQLEIWNTKLPSRADTKHTNALYGYLNFEYILFGSGWAPGALKDPPRNATPPDTSEVRRRAQRARQALLPHAAFIQKYLKSESAGRDDTERTATMPTLDPATALSQFSG